MYAKVESLGLNGLDAFSVTVEADISTGLPRFDIVGLPDMAVRESRERVRATIKNGGYQFPVSRMTVNIAPADVKKEGAVYDLPVFVALMKASGQIHGSTDGCAFLGELSLDGEIRSCTGVLPMVLCAREKGLHAVFVPAANRDEGSIVEGIDVLPVAHVRQVLDHLQGTGRALLPGIFPGGGHAGVSGLCRCKGAAERQAGAGDRSCRGTQLPDDRPAGHRKVYAGQAAAVYFAGNDL